MRIVFEKGIKVCQMVEVLQEFILEQAVEYPILKKNMVVNISLKNSINQINPNNEREFSFTQKEMSEIEEVKRTKGMSRADFMFNEEWSFFTGNCSGSIIQEIESDKKYLESAVEMGRSMKNIEKRKKSLEKNKKRLEQECERMRVIAPYIAMYEKDQVEFKYESVPYYDDFDDEWLMTVIKKMIFMNGDIFEYDASCFGMAHIKSYDGQVIVL